MTLVIVTKILLIRPAKLIIIERCWPVRLLGLALWSAGRAEFGCGPLHWLVLTDVTERGTVVAVVEAGASLQLNTAFIRFDDLVGGCSVHFSLCRRGYVVVNLLSL